jgi:hypothetical protein
MKPTIFIFSLILILAGCTNRNKENQSVLSAIDKVENLHRSFNPNYNADTSSVELYITFKVLDGQIVQKPLNVEIVLGKGPFSSKEGSFLLTYKDSLSREIITYKIENPLRIHTSDEKDKPAVSFIKDGKVSIRLPFSPKARYLELSDTEQKEFNKVTIELVPVFKEFKITLR